jgi:hypothetical protein
MRGFSTARALLLVAGYVAVIVGVAVAVLGFIAAALNGWRQLEVMQLQVVQFLILCGVSFSVLGVVLLCRAAALGEYLELSAAIKRLAPKE